MGLRIVFRQLHASGQSTGVQFPCESTKLLQESLRIVVWLIDRWILLQKKKKKTQIFTTPTNFCKIMYTGRRTPACVGTGHACVDAQRLRHGNDHGTGGTPSSLCSISPVAPTGSQSGWCGLGRCVLLRPSVRTDWSLGLQRPPAASHLASAVLKL
jgi:hypothetical protein